MPVHFALAIFTFGEIDSSRAQEGPGAFEVLGALDEHVSVGRLRRLVSGSQDGKPGQASDRDLVLAADRPAILLLL